MASTTHRFTVGLLGLVLATAAAACDGGTREDLMDDHAIGTRVLEGDELAAFFGADGVTEPMFLEHGFRRVGLLWDAATAAGLELRTSTDGVTWTPWAAPQVVSSEEGGHAGHVDAITVGAEGSDDLDPTASWLQLRLAAGAAAPSFLVVEPLPDIPPAVDPQELILDTVDGDHGDDDEDGLFSVVKSTPIGGIRIYTRADWGARAPRCGSGTATPNRVTIHHTVTPTNDSMTAPARLRQIQAFHMFTNGWCDIGYNYLVSRDGRVWRGRGAKTIGAHVANANSGNVGISFMGTHTSTRPTLKQECQTAKLIRRLRMEFPGIALTRTDIKGHRQYGGTACPGNALYGRIDDIIRKAKNGC